MMSKLGLAVVGVGDMGRRHAENIRGMVPGARLVAVADADAARAKRVAAELDAEASYGSIEALLENKNVDCVVTASPDKFHASGIQAAAAAGKDILCEKPIALSLKEAQSALDAVAKAKVRLQIGFMRRYDPAYAAAMKRIEAGEIGEPVVFKSIGRDQNAPPMAAYESHLNGMLFYNSTIHDFDLARWLVRDEVSEVQAYSTCAIRPEVAKHGDIVAGLVNLKYQRGAIGNIESYVQAAYGYDIRTEIVGSKGSILVGTLQRHSAMVLTGNGGSQAMEHHFLTRFADAYLAEMQDFVQRMATDQPPLVTGEDGFRALAIAVAAENSLRQSKPVKVSSEAS
jgi:scyllo-inositol 2-dehydrogenase (NAD+)